MTWTDSVKRIDASVVRTFGRDVTFTPQGQAGAVVTGIFNAQGEVVEIAGDVLQQSRQPRVTLNPSDLAQYPAQGDTVTVNSVDFEVTEVDPPQSEGFDLVRCRLREL